MKETGEILVCDTCKTEKGLEGQNEVKKCIICGKDVCRNCCAWIDLACTIDSIAILNYQWSRQLRACKVCISVKETVLVLIDRLKKRIMDVDDDGKIKDIDHLA